MPQRGTTPEAAVDAAYRMVQRELHDIRAARRAHISVGAAQEAWQARGPRAAGQATRAAPQA